MEYEYENKNYFQKKIFLTILLCLKHQKKFIKIPRCVYQNCIVTDYLKNEVLNGIDECLIFKMVMEHGDSFFKRYQVSSFKLKNNGL